MLFVVWGLMRLCMKWKSRKKPESHVIPEQDKEPKAGHLLSSPCVYLPFVKSTFY